MMQVTSSNMTDLDLHLLLSVHITLFYFLSLLSTSSFASKEHTSLVVKYCIARDPLYSLVLRCSVFAKSDECMENINILI